jgi:hypothetical protein
MRSRVFRERILFLLFLAMAAGMVVTGIMGEQIPETLFNATLV